MTEYSEAKVLPGSPDNISLNEIKEIVWHYHPHVEFEYRPDRSGDVLYTKADTEPMTKLGWQTCVKIKEGLTRCFEGVKNDRV